MNERHYRELHRELWEWLIHNPSRNKEQWPRWVSNGGDIQLVVSYCFACFLWSSSSSCKDCKLDNTALNHKEAKEDSCLCGIFSKWQNAKTRWLRIKYATIIRDLWPPTIETSKEES